MAVFMGYASLVTFQKKLKDQFDKNVDLQHMCPQSELPSTNLCLDTDDGTSCAEFASQGESVCTSHHDATGKVCLWVGSNDWEDACKNLTPTTSVVRPECCNSIDVYKNTFEHGTSMNYIGNMIFRLGHAIVWAYFRPRARVYIGMLCILTSQVLIGFFVFILKSNFLGLVYMAYFLGGCGVGTFSGNFFSCLTPLGDGTKMWALIGLPLGFNIVSVGGFLVAYAARSVGLDEFGPSLGIYIAVAAMNIAGIVTWYMIEDIPIKGNATNLREFWQNLVEWKQWLGSTWQYLLAFYPNMFCVAFFSAINFYIMNNKDGVAILGEDTQHESNTAVWPWNLFFAMLGLFTFCGDTFSRKISYYIRPLNPFLYLILSLTGAILNFLKIPLLSCIGMCLIFYANGAMYASANRYIDNHVDKKYNLTALSVWLFFGDLGSTTGSNVWQPVLHSFVCPASAQTKTIWFCSAKD